MSTYEEMYADVDEIIDDFGSTHDDFGNKIVKKLSKGDESCTIVQTKNGDILTDEEFHITNINEPDWEDKVDEFTEEWNETHWDNSDWADYYGCDESQVQDCMDDDMRDYDD